MSTPQIIPQRCPQCGAPLPLSGEHITCEYCGSSLIRQGVSPAAPSSKEACGVHFKTIAYVDQQGIGIEAFRFLIPAQWEFEGGVHWLLNNPGMPAVIAFRAYNPQGAEMFEVFPNISCYWTNNPMVMGMFPVGSLYYGNEVRPPIPALQALQELVIPRYRGQMAGLRVVQREHLPELMQKLRPAPNGITNADGARVRIRYHHGGREVEEDIFGLVEVNRVALPMMFGMVEHIYWMADYLFSCRALADQLDKLAATFMAIIHSFRLNPQWYGRYMQISQFMIQNQIQQIHHVGEVSRIISQTSAQISDMMMESYYQRQGIMDRLATQFSQAIRGVDEYYNPFEERGIELPGGYNYAWSNALGEYILTDDPGFNPNIGSNLTWEQMARR